VVALAAFAVGCHAESDPCAGKTGTCLAVTVTSSQVHNVDTLHMVASGALGGVRDSTTGKSTTLPARLALLLPIG
jgi:hypothetical protein